MMAMACKICNHPKKLEIDRMLVAGKSYQMVANKYGVDWQAVRRHKENHLSRQLVTAMAKKELTESMDLLSRIEKIISRAEKIFRRNYSKNTTTGDNLALKSISEQRSTIELLAKIAAFLHESRAMELQANNRDEELAEEQKKQLQVLSSDELIIFRSILDKMKSGDKDRRVRIPYSYIGRKERHQEKGDFEKEYITPIEEPESETIPEYAKDEEVPSEEAPEYVKDETDSYTVPKMTRTKKPNPLAVKPDNSSPRVKLPRRIDNWIDPS